MGGGNWAVVAGECRGEEGYSDRWAGTKLPENKRGNTYTHAQAYTHAYGYIHVYAYT